MQTTTSYVDRFNQPRNHEDLDLINQVRTALINAGLTEDVLAIYDNSFYIQNAKDKTPNVQRYLLNQFWNIQLMTVNVDSLDIRFNLVPNGTVDEWFNLFRKNVLPFIIMNNLPVMIH